MSKFKKWFQNIFLEPTQPEESVKEHIFTEKFPMIIPKEILSVDHNFKRQA